MVDEEDSLLVRQCLEGNQARFGDLVRKYTKPIFNLALRMTGDADHASDVTQVTFMKAYENLARFDQRLKFFSWIYRIAINESLNFIQKQKQTDQLSEDTVSDDGSPEDSLQQAERTEMIQQAILKLTPEQRSVITLRHFMDLSYEQMSATLGIPEAKVKSRLFSARQHLRKLLINKGL